MCAGCLSLLKGKVTVFFLVLKNYKINYKGGKDKIELSQNTPNESTFNWENVLFSPTQI